MSNLPSGTSRPTDASNNVGIGAGPLQVVSASSNSESVGAGLNIVGEVVTAVVASLVVSDRLTTLLDVADRSGECKSGACGYKEDVLERRHSGEFESQIL